MHWVWEPWEVAAIHHSRPAATSRRKLASFQTSTRKIHNIPLNVDYKKEIEPNLGPLLVHGRCLLHRLSSRLCREKVDLVKYLLLAGEDSPLL